MEPTNRTEFRGDWDKPRSIWRFIGHIVKVVVGGVVGFYVGGSLGYLCLYLVGPLLFGEEFHRGLSFVISIIAMPVSLGYGTYYGAKTLARNPRVFIATFLPIAILFGIRDITVSIFRRIDRPRQFVVELSGTPGAEYLGAIFVDGQTQKRRGVLPDQFEYEALQIEFAFALARQNEGHKISAETSVNGTVISRHYEYETGVHQSYHSYGYAEGAFGGTSGGGGILPPKFSEQLMNDQTYPWKLR